MNVDATISIDRPIDDVFAYVTHVPNMANWVTGVSSAELVSEVMGPGAQFVCRYTSNFRSDELVLEVTAYEPSARFGTKMARGPFSFEGVMTLATTGDGTKVTNSIVVDPDSLATRLASLLFGWFVRPSMRRRLRRELEALNQAISGGRLADA